MAFYSLHVSSWGFSPNYSVTSAVAYNETDVLIAMVTFLVGTLIAGFAPTFSVFISRPYRQAVATGLISPLLMNTILIICPPENVVPQWD